MISSLPLYNWPILATNDPRLTCSHMRSNLRPNELNFPGRPKLDFLHNKVMLNSISLNSIHYGCEVNIQAPPTEDIYLAIITLDGYGEFEQDNAIVSTKPGDIYLMNPLFPLNISLSADFKQLTVQLDGKRLKQYASQMTGYPMKDPLIFQPIDKSNLKNNNSFKSLIETICNNVNSPHSSLLHRQVVANLEDTLLSLLLAEFPNNYSEYITGAQLSPTPYYVRRAQNYIHENICEPIAMDQLTLITGVSARCLQKGFKSALGTTPTSYIRTLRLDMARRRLMSASEEGESITEIAYSCGFEHLSKFSQHYKELFDESPMETKMYQRTNKKML